MNNLFNNIIQMNIYASIAIIVVVVFRALFKFIPKKFVCLLWVVVAVRLVCPYSIESKLSILNLLPGNEMINISELNGAKSNKADVDAVNTANNKGVSNVQVDTANVFLNNNSKESVNTKTNNFKEIKISVIKKKCHFIWIVGLLIIAFGQIVNYVKLSMKLKKIDKTVCDGYIESEFITTPFTAGIIKPIIYIPKGMNEGEKEYILLHEKIHVKNKDCVIKTFSAVLLCVNWFNPFVWVAYRLMCDDLEMRCDEEVVKSMDADVMHEYCMSIVLHSIDSKASYKIPGVCFAQRSFGGMEVKMRIKNMFSKKVSKNAAIDALAVSAITATVLSTQAKADNKNGNEVATSVVEESTEVDEVVTEKNTTIEETQSVAEKSDEKNELNDSDKKDLLMKYAKEYTDKGYKILDDVNNYRGVECVTLVDDNTSGDNNEIIFIYSPEEKYDSTEDLIKAIKEDETLGNSKEISVDGNKVSVTNEVPGVITECSVHEGNVIVKHTIGLLNGIG